MGLLSTVERILCLTLLLEMLLGCQIDFNKVIMLTNWTKIVLHFLMMIKFNHVQILNTAPKKLYVKFTSLLVYVLNLNIQLCFLRKFG